MQITAALKTIDDYDGDDDDDDDDEDGDNHTCDLSFFVRQRNFQNFKLYAEKCVNSRQ